MRSRLTLTLCLTILLFATPAQAQIGKNVNSSGAIHNNTNAGASAVTGDNKNDTVTPADKNEPGFSQTEIETNGGIGFSQEKIMPDSNQHLDHNDKGMGFSQNEIDGAGNDMGFSQEKIGGNKESDFNEQKGNEGHGFSQSEVGGNQNSGGDNKNQEGHGFSQSGIGNENGNSGEKGNNNSNDNDNGGGNSNSSSEVSKNDNGGSSSDNSLEGDNKNNNDNNNDDGSDDDKPNPDDAMPDPEGNGGGNPWSKGLNKGKIGEYTPADKAKGAMGGLRDKMKSGEYTPAEKAKGQLNGQRQGMQGKMKIGEYTPADKNKTATPPSRAPEVISPEARSLQKLPSGLSIGNGMASPAISKP